MKRTTKIYYGYIITNQINNKKYVGITSHTPQQRWNTHKQDAKFTKSKYRNHFHNAINKYTPEAFKIKTAAKSKSWEKICLWEIQTIKKLNTKNPINGYNLTDGGEGAPGIERTEDFKEKLSKIKKKYYENPIRRKEQSIRNKQIWGDEKLLLQARKTSKRLWKDPQYKKKTIENNKKRWDAPEMRKKHKQAIRKATTLNPEWHRKNKERNIIQAKDPEWRKKVSEGVKKIYLNNKKAHEKAVKRAKTYWEEGHEDRRKKHAETMSKMIKEKLKQPAYQKWRKENPPGGKPIMYQFKYFRSTSEACRFFKTNRAKINRGISKETEGCCKLDPTKTYKFEIQYNEFH